MVQRIKNDELDLETQSLGLGVISGCTTEKGHKMGFLVNIESAVSDQSEWRGKEGKSGMVSGDRVVNSGLRLCVDTFGNQREQRTWNWRVFPTIEETKF